MSDTEPMSGDPASPDRRSAPELDRIAWNVPDRVSRGLRLPPEIAWQTDAETPVDDDAESGDDEDEVAAA